MEKLTQEAIETILIEEIAKEMGIDAENVTANMSLQDDLGMGSLDQMNIIMEMEDKFKVEVDIEELLERPSINELAKYLHEFI